MVGDDSVFNAMKVVDSNPLEDMNAEEWNKNRMAEVIIESLPENASLLDLIRIADDYIDLRVSKFDKKIDSEFNLKKVTETVVDEILTKDKFFQAIPESLVADFSNENGAINREELDKKVNEAGEYYVSDEYQKSRFRKKTGEKFSGEFEFKGIPGILKR